MNLVFVGPSFGGVGGTEGQGAQLARWFAARGHAVTLVARWVDPALLGACRFIQVDVPGGAVGALAWPLVSRLRLPDADVVVGFGRGLGHQVFRAGGGTHAAYCAAMGGRRAADALHLALDRLALRSARVVICNSRMGADDVARAAPGVRTVVIRNAVDVSRFSAWDGDRGAAKRALGVPGRLALFLGSGFARKGLPAAAEAFAAVAGPDDRLVVLGGDRRGVPAAIVGALGRRLVAPGPARPDAWLLAADAMILPTRYDPSANAVLEAMAAGAPPVTTTRDGAAEIVPDRRLIVGPGGGPALAQALGYAWGAGSSLRRRVRAAAEPWTIDRCGEATEEIYREIAER